MGKLRYLTAFLILVVSLASTAVIASLQPEFEDVLNRIAFVDIEGTVRTVSPDGTLEKRISPEAEGFFTWPTWSPDGRSLVYSGVLNRDSSQLQMSLFASNSNGSRNREIYTGEPGVVGLLAEGVVHYPLWSPDSEQLAFVAQTSSGLTLFLDDLSLNPDAEQILDNGPLWMSWSPDSSNLVVHRGDDHFLIDASGEIAVNEISIDTSGYRVPAWKPKEGLITVATQESLNQYTISLTGFEETGTDVLQPLTRTDEIPVFLWSPDGKFLAVSDSNRVFAYQGLQIFVYQSLTILPDGDTDRPTVIREPILAYFWSPDSTKIAYITLAETRGVLRWMILDLAEQKQWPLVDFIPSLEQLTMFQFFDQYAYSHSLWSPNSDALVFAGNLRAESITASYREHPGHEGFHIIVVNADPAASPQTIAEGFLAFWSPK